MTTIEELRQRHLEFAIRCQSEASALWRAAFEERELDAELATVIQLRAAKTYAVARAFVEEAHDDAFLRNWRNRINRHSRKQQRARREAARREAARRDALTLDQRIDDDRTIHAMLHGLFTRDVQ